jgi:hypothetical protein
MDASDLDAMDLEETPVAEDLAHYPTAMQVNVNDRKTKTMMDVALPGDSSSVAAAAASGGRGARFALPPERVDQTGTTVLPEVDLRVMQRREVTDPQPFIHLMAQTFLPPQSVIDSHRRGPNGEVRLLRNPFPPPQPSGIAAKGTKRPSSSATRQRVAASPAALLTMAGDGTQDGVVFGTPLSQETIMSYLSTHLRDDPVAHHDVNQHLRAAMPNAAAAAAPADATTTRRKKRRVPVDSLRNRRFATAQGPVVNYVHWVDAPPGETMRLICEQFHMDDPLEVDTGYEKPASAYRMLRELLKKYPHADPQASWRDTRETGVGNVPRRVGIPQMTRRQLEVFRMPRPSTWIRHCVNGAACLFNKSPELGGYIGREFYPNWPFGEPVPDPIHDTTAPLVPCIDCVLFQLTMRSQDNSTLLPEPIHPINTFTVVVGPGGYHEKCLLPQDKRTGIVGPVPMYFDAQRVYREIHPSQRVAYGLDAAASPGQGRLFYRAETNMDFPDASTAPTGALDSGSAGPY